MTRDKWFLLGAVCFCAGILLYPYIKIGAWQLYLLSGVLVALLFLLTETNAKVLTFALLCVVAGFIRFDTYGTMASKEEVLANFDGKEVALECRISKMPEVKNGKQQLELDVIDADEKAYPGGNILAFMSAYGDYSYGEKVRFEGKIGLAKNPEGFDYRQYLFQKGIYFVSYRPDLSRVEKDEVSLVSSIYALRKETAKRLGKILPSPQSSILSAMTLGMNSDEMRGVMDEFNTTGTSHIIVVSGSHLVVVIALLSYIFLGINLNRKHVFYVLLLGLIAYIILTGSGVSALRSGIMASIFLLAVKIGRSKRALNALVLSAAIMIFLNPYVLTGDVSFQLSFLSTFGIVYLAPLIEKKMEKLPERVGVKEMTIMTLSAQLATMPVIIANFGQVSLLSLLANILILPTVPLLMIGGYAVILLSFVSLTLAEVAVLPLYAIISYYMIVVGHLASTNLGLIKF
jgi:competence protein ComEC